jgi:hypothetical protein
MKTYLTLFILLLPFNLLAQETMNDSLPYYEIPEAPAEYTAATVAARMIDGLGFRYYWATEGLRTEDLAYKPSPEARTSGETIDHIYGLARMINLTVNGVAVTSSDDDMTFDEKRAMTLTLLYEASMLLLENPDLAKRDIVFNRGDSSTEYPFWNLINGPIEDAVWHTGQVVSFRRASGNPFNSTVSVFTGKLKTK